MRLLAVLFVAVQATYYFVIWLLGLGLIVSSLQLRHPLRSYGGCLIWTVFFWMLMFNWREPSPDDGDGL